MTEIDWIIVGIVAALAIFGYRRGLIVGGLMLAGFAGGAFLGARLAPTLLEEGSRSPYAPVTALAGGVLLGGLLAVLLEALAQALRPHAVRARPLRVADALGGAAVFAALALGIVWLLGAVALNASGTELRRDAQRSVILQRLNEALPPTGSVLNILNRINPTPSLRGPDADVASPNAALAEDERVHAASASVVRVLGTACGLGVEGSGWVAAPGLVVTNAHVVAGQTDTTVTAPGGGPLAATAVRYDPRNDLAVLRVDGLDAPALDLVGSPDKGTAGATIGYPENGPLTATAARLGTTARVPSEDAYGRGPVQRRIAAFRGRVRSGNSGGPVVDRQGRVLTTVFASSLSGGPPSGLGVPNPIVRRALGKAGDAVDTGPCAT